MNARANKIILIVDDQPASLRILLSFLQDRHFELRVLQSGRQALEVVQEIEPDIILLDVLMPDMDGLETCRRLKKDKGMADIPVIFMTALNSVEDKIAGFKAGGVDYITKPFQQAEVLARISTHLSLKETRERLRHQNSMLESLLNSIQDPIYFKNMQNHYLGCNRAFEKFAGKTEQELLGSMDETVLPPEMAASFHSSDQEMLGACTAARTEETVVCPDGRTAIFDVLKTPYIGPDGNLLGLIGICRNITELKQAEQQAAEERERLRVTLHSIGDGVIATDVCGRITSLNNVAEQLTGWSNEQAIGLPSAAVFKIIDEKTEEPCADPVRRALALGRMTDLENGSALIRQDGSHLSIADSCAPIRSREGRIIGTVIVFRDATYEKERIKELIKIKKLESVSLLARGIAHDFNNILSAILGNIELASEAVTSDPQTEMLLASAQKAAERAAKLTKQLMIFAKGGEPVKEAVALPELIRDSADFILHGSQVVCDYDFAEDLWLINADSSQITQVIQNIIINAKQAMPKGGGIRISCQNAEVGTAEPQSGLRKGRFVRISIADSGPGIPPEIISKIFDLHFTTKQDGNGLGLAICQLVTQKHEGSITVQSEPGNGSVFTVMLPAAQSGSSVQSRPAEPKEERQMARIIVMDDDQMLRDLAKAQLRSLGHEAVLAADGAEAVSLYRELRESGSPADLVIMDLTVPGGMGGQEAARQILALDAEAKLIVASGYSDDPVLSEYKKYGFQAAVAKPFSLAELRQALAAVL
ncbi:histidine kinase [Candidatus Electronema halotolerans]